MDVPAAIVILPLGLLFIASGLVINLIQAICFVLIRPLSKSTYRRINKVVAELLWLEPIWLVDWWAGVKLTQKLKKLKLIELYSLFFVTLYIYMRHILQTNSRSRELAQIKVFTDSETFSLMGKEHALVTSNHRSDIDWLVGWVLAQRSDCLGSALAVMKRSSKFLPVIGWSMWFSEYLFLERSWAKDERTLKSGLQRLNDFPLPFWLALFVEGTRYTPAKLKAAQEYALSTGLPVPRNVLIPRTKGFVAAVRHMRSFVPAIYDITVGVPKSSPPPTLLRLFKGQSSVVHVHIKRHLMKDLPESEEAIAQWCRDMFLAKDALLDKHVADDTFNDEELHVTSRPIKPLLVIISWACLLLLGAAKFLQWSALLSSWNGAAISACGLVLVTVLMQILIRFSQSEHSTPAKIAPSEPKNGEAESKARRYKQQ